VDGKPVVLALLRHRSLLLGDKKDLSFTCVYVSFRLFSYSCFLLFLVSLLVINPPILRTHLSSRSAAEGFTFHPSLDWTWKRSSF
jgi:hypothetical protein